MNNFIYSIIVLPLVIPVLLILYIFNIRIRSVGMDRIGDAVIFFRYLRSKRGNDVFYIRYSNLPYCNSQWAKMLSRKYRFFPFRRFFSVLEKVNNMIPGHRSFIIPRIDDKEQFNIDYMVEPYIEFTKKETKKGLDLLSQMGLGYFRPEKYICFFTRDSSYLNKTQKGKDWSYHDYRNTSIKNYVTAVDKFLDKYYYIAFRMGSVVEEPVNSNNLNIIDYTKLRTEFLDIFLFSRCEFTLATDCGLMIVPEALMKPVIYSNFVSISHLPNLANDSIIIPKKWYYKKEKRFLKLSEIFKVAHPQKIDLNSLGVELIDNTVEDILSSMFEMQNIINGINENKDEELQSKFWDLYGRNKLMPPRRRISNDFLINNKEMIG